ncbi:MAG: hypothetical protein COA99_01605 [Moraxellaceae bacterium]|nr:MAG: hypothetical protein COA99_01605 [Moraxellaceae bacterium]
MSVSNWVLVDSELGIWEATYKCPPAISRTVAVRLKSGGYLVYSAGKDLLASAQEGFLKDTKVEIILVPNTYHHLGISTWLQAYPEAMVVASGASLGRLKKNGHKNVGSVSVIIPLLPSEVKLLEPPSTRNGELWLVATTSNGNLWIVCDSFFNYTKKAKGIVGRGMQLIMGTGPGLTVSRVVFWTQVKNYWVYNRWIKNQLKNSPPTTLIPSHGKILTDDNLPQRLEGLL